MATALQNSSSFKIKTDARHRIGAVTAGFLVALALLVDAIHFGVYLVGLIPVIGWAMATVVPPLISAGAGILFYLWYKLLGINFLDGSVAKATTFFGSMVVEFVPFINALPMWTLGVVFTIMVVRGEDALYNKRHGLS